MRRVISILAFTFCTLLTAAAQKKQNVSVLYVYGSADLETAGLEVQPSPEALAASVAERTASFTKFFKKNFKTVRCVDAKDYNWQMSADYDVTVLDGKPEPIAPGIYEIGSDGYASRYERPQYFPFNFDRPVITIANFGEEMGRRIGTKNDWYCLCLEDYALGWNAEHPVFQGPVKVNFTVEDQPTPAPALEVAKMMGEPLDATTPMFRMQVMNYEQNRDYRIGMVSRPGGYLDSPETEVISGGKCGKSIDAVAIGRHANWMTWGFSASPAYMTDAARALFVNAVVYMKQFAGVHPIARKLHDGVATRDHIAQWKYLTSREGWVADCRMMAEFNEQMHHLQDSLQAIVDGGGEIDPNYAIYLQFPDQEIPSYRDFVRGNAKELYAVFGEDEAEYARYYDRNFGYFYCTPDGYDLKIDEDARYLGIANNDKSILERCISILEKGEEDVTEAQNILKRYTLCRFETPAQWREWYETYKDKLFFTESGGYLWLVDTFEDVPGNDYNVLLQEREAAYAAASGLVNADSGEVTTDLEPVYLAAGAVQTSEGKDIVIYQEIRHGYHTYAVVPEDQTFVETTVTIELPGGYEFAGQLYTPAASPLDASGTMVFKGTGEFRQAIVGQGSGEATVTVHFQCCNDNGCLIPQTKKFTVTL